MYICAVAAHTCLPAVGCDVNFAGSNFFKGSRFVVSDLSLALYSALYAYDGW